VLSHVEVLGELSFGVALIEGEGQKTHLQNTLHYEMTVTAV
jgi:hypothetical protein